MFGACACAWQVCAAPTPLAPPVFRVHGTEQGLPSRQVQTLAQDHDGRLWVGTGAGLVRFDGHQFVAYPARLEQSNALASTSVEALAIAADGRLWIGTQGGHLALRRAATDDFERLDLRAAVGADQLEVWSLASAGERVWVGTYGAGLLEMDLTGRMLRQHPLADPALHLTEVLAADDGKLWLVGMDQQLLRFDPRTAQAVPVRQPAGEPPLRVYGAASRADALWFSTRDGRLCSAVLDQAADCRNIPLLAVPGKAHMLLPAARGDWVGGSGELLRLIDGRAQRAAFDPGSIGGVPAQPLWTALRDGDGGLWFGSTGGGLLHLGIDADRFQVWQPSVTGRSGLRDGRVRGVADGGDGHIYIATLNGGLHRLDPLSGAIRPMDLPGTTERRVWAVLREGGDGLWVGYQNGLMQLLFSTSGPLRLHRHWSAEQLVGPMVDLLHRDADGHIWAASMGAGLNRIDPADGTVTHFPFTANGLAGTEIQQLGNGIDGRTWAATDRGLHAFDPDCTCWRQLISAARVEAWAQLDAERIDAFVDHQLVRYRWRDGLFRDESVAPRAFAEFQTVGGMARHADALWLAGTQGLYRFVRATDRLEAFDTRDGLPTREFSDRPMHVDAQGRLWIGSEDGLISLDPAFEPEAPPAARLRFEQLRISGTDGPRDLMKTSNVELEPGDRDLQAVVRLTSLARPHAQRYSFRVRGWDPGWSIPAAQPERRLEALPSGRYTLEVKAWDGYGQAAANTLNWPFVVLPPWWRAPPALLGYLLLLVGLIALTEVWRRRRRLAAALLLETQRQAQWAERLAAEKSALVAELSHEIRNPLNGVLGMGRLLSAQALGIDGRRYVDLLLDAGRQLTRLLDDMLDWSRLEARSAMLPLQPVPLLPTLTATLAWHAEQARERGLAFSVEIETGLAAMADASRLQQVLANLISNAIKFTSVGGITVRAQRVGERVEIRVQDSGPGMNAGQIERLFRPFERVGDERAAPGTGLGLAISRSLSERMGGEVRVESEVGVGSCFVLTLAAAPAVAQRSQVQGNARPVRGPSLEGLRVLVVDDDLIARELMQSELGVRGAVVHCVPEALSALIVLQQQDFEVALVDWDLPGMHGVDLARMLRAQKPGLPLIAVTGRTTPADYARSVDAGFAAHVAKPVDPDRLAGTMMQVLADAARSQVDPAPVGPDLSGCF
jgi:signal transduction histidine kinase/ligand-binding sensor domain-containing protein/CheY-like chemotaxis protein